MATGQSLWFWRSVELDWRLGVGLPRQLLGHWTNGGREKQEQRLGQHGYDDTFGCQVVLDG